MTAKTHEEITDRVADKISQIPGFIKSQHDKLLEQGQFIAIDVLASIVLDYEIWPQEGRKAELERLRAADEMVSISQEGGGYDGDSHNPLINENN